MYDKLDEIRSTPETKIQIFQRKIKFLSLGELYVLLNYEIGYYGNDCETVKESVVKELVETEISNRISKLFENE